MGSENMHAPPLRGDVTRRRVQKGSLGLVVFTVMWFVFITSLLWKIKIYINCYG